MSSVFYKYWVGSLALPFTRLSQLADLLDMRVYSASILWFRFPRHIDGVPNTQK